MTNGKNETFKLSECHRKPTSGSFDIPPMWAFHECISLEQLSEPHDKCIRLTFHMCTFSTFTTFHVNFHSTRLHYMLLLSAGKLLHIIFISFECTFKPSSTAHSHSSTERFLFHFQAFNLLLFCLRQFHEYIHLVYTMKLSDCMLAQHLHFNVNKLPSFTS